LVVALTVPTGFNAVGQYYLDFAQVADDDVVALLTGGARTI
jgi:predicted phosphoribosyltransferase